MPIKAVSFLLFSGLMSLGFSAVPLAAQTWTAPRVAGDVEVEASGQAETLHLVVGRSLVLSTASPLKRVYVGDAKVLQTFSSGTKEEVITAKICGVSTLILWDLSGRRRVYTVLADLDTDGIRKVLEDAVPGSRLTVATKGNRIYLGGTVPNEAAVDGVGKLASAYSKDLVNGVKVLTLRPKQVELKLRIVEVDRTRLEQFGLNFFSGVATGSILSGTSTGQFQTTVMPSTSGSGITVTNPLDVLLYSSKLNVGVTLQDLEQKQVFEVLAEPTLTTLSGVSARFLSGGEFPLPIVQGGTGNSTAITIVFKPYGVKVDFTPTVNEDDSIRLKVAPEVSTLDYSNAVTISGFTIPALSTRRAETEVEIANGQSFVLSGLLDHRTTDNLSRMPGISDIPILGQLFRSKGVNHSVIELLVLVTATVVDPLAAPQTPVLPKMVVPHMDSDRFDHNFHAPGAKKSSLTADPQGPGSAAAPLPEANPASNPAFNTEADNRAARAAISTAAGKSANPGKEKQP